MIGASSAGRALYFVLVTVALSSCSVWPLKQASSLSPAIKADAIDYNDAVGDAADRILLTNILRSKDLAPLNLSQLSSLSGALSLQGTLGFSLPWGHGVMGTGPSDAQNIATPSIVGSTTPTYSLTPLNTQAFMLSILQPVSAAYVLNRWQSGLSREMLLLLFVKEVDLPDSAAPGGASRFINDADDDARLRAFVTLVHDLVTANVQLKAFDILDPVGPPFSLYASSTTTSNSGGTNSKSDMTPKTNADATGFGAITNTNDLQYHVGNVLDKSVSLQDGTSVNINKGGQLYRVYAGQVALCVDAEVFTKATHYSVPPLNRAITNPTIADESQWTQGVGKGALVNHGLFLNSMSAGPTAGTPGAAPGAATPKTAGGATSGAAGSASQAVTAALQAGRVSALVDSRGCRPDEIVLDQSSEDDFASESKGFIHVQWRSVSEIFEYLGAVLRANERNKTDLAFTTAVDASIKVDTEAGKVYPTTGKALLFRVHQKAILGGPLSVSYNNAFYGVDESLLKDTDHNYTMTILSMLSNLVDLAAQPSIGASSSQPLRLLPIP
jgi:hypothetical protein